MIVVSAGTFMNEVLDYINMAAKGEELEIILPNKAALQVKIKDEEERIVE